MIVLQSNQLVKALNENDKQGNATVSLGDIIDLYAQIIMGHNNMIDDTTLQKLLCKQTRSYCDFDKTVQESSKIISDVSNSADKLIMAVKEQDQDALDEAFEQFKIYQTRIKELQTTLYTDELTLFLNRRYLLSEKLKDGSKFIGEGILFVLLIDNFQEINHLHGYSDGDKVLKYFATNINTMLNAKHYEIIRFSGAIFVTLVKEHQVSVIERRLEGFQQVLKHNSFKTSDGGTIKLNLLYGHELYHEGEAFTNLLTKISARLTE
jgi:diguanylate cyclase (GGDEF)-like protein